MKKSINKITDKTWGFEHLFINNELYCTKHLGIKKGFQTSIHYHKKKDETFYVLEGKIEIFIYDKKLNIQSIKLLKKDESFRIKSGIIHKTFARETSIILETSTHHKDSDVFRIEEKKKGNYDNK